jgi:mono/diheme cytochrome c family protein
VLTPSLRAAAPVDYQRDIQPILAKNCVSCHGADKQKGALRLDTVAAALRGGDAGPAIVPGKSAASPLFQSVTGGGDVRRMPPKSKLTAAEIALLKTWIDAGAKAPAGEKAAPVAAANKRMKGDDDDDDDDKEREGRKKGREREKDRKKKREREDD